MGSTIIAGASAFVMGGAASAQTASAGATANAPAAIAEVTVTGSRIRSPNLTSVSPLTVVSDQEIKLQGASNIENLLNGLPQITAGQQSNVSNGASGTATVDLRDLGPARTLVLVDGKRLMPGDPKTPFADLNNIPSALVERVDVVTGGASAVYGADAVAGVVNFILKKNFQGVELDGQYGIVQHNNGNSGRSIQGVQGISNFLKAPTNYSNTLSTEVSAIIGVNSPDDKGNITAYATYRNLQAITQDKYDVSSCSISATNTSGPDSYIYNGHACQGSSNSQFGRFTLQNDGSRNPGSLGGTRFHVNPNGTATFTTAAVPSYNYAPTNYFQRPEDRYTAGFNAHYRVNAAADVYADLLFADDHTVAQIAPSGLFAGGGPNKQSFYSINCNNPLLAASQQAQLCGAQAGTGTIVNAQIGFRFAGLNRQDDLRHTNYKIDIGSRGELGQGWSYDAYLQYGTSIFNEHYNNDASSRKIQNALIVDPTTGKCVAESTLCVPLNIFQFGKLTPQQLAYVVTPGFQSGQTTEQIASVSVTGDIGQYGFKSPYANSGISLALGTEYRSESLTFNTDNEYQTGDLSGQGATVLPNSGSFDVYELFGEARIPLVEDVPFIKSLNLDLGYRFSDYSTSGTTDAYKVEGDWAITRDVRLRGGYNRAVRAPNVNELFTSQQIQNVGANDPCAGQATYTQGCINSFATTAALLGTTPAALAARFPGSGLGQCPAAQCSGLVSGNRNLKPEQADTFTFGVVFTPTWHWLHGFSASIDYYNIEVDNVISAPAPQLILNECVNGITAACTLVQRDATSGILYGNSGYVIDQTINGGFIKTEGYDVTAAYRFNLHDWSLPDWGSVAINFVGTYISKFTTQPIANGPAYDCAGLYGAICGTPLPHWKSRVRFTYTPPTLPLNLSLDWRYVGAVKFDANQGNQGSTPFGAPLVGAAKGNYLLANHPSGITDTADERIHAFNYIDLSATWRVRPNLNLRFGVTNVFDTDAPIVDANVVPAAGPPTGNGNTYPGVYDSLGRTFFIGLTADF